MSIRHHPIQNGAVMMVTTVTQERFRKFANDAYARESVETLYRVQQLRPFFLYGFVIMPEHCHLLLKVPEPATISMVMKQFKAGTSHNIGHGPIWQHRFHVMVPDDPGAALAYIHRNPVKAGLAESAETYPWSSACGKWDISPLIVW